MPLLSLRRFCTCFIFISVSLSMLPACQNTEQNKRDLPISTPTVQTYSLIFLDKTVSVSPKDTFIMNKYSAALSEIVNGNILQKDDKIEVYFLHENTLQAKVFASQCKSAIRADTTGLSPTDIKAIKNSYFLSLKKEKNKILNKCLEALFDANITETRKYTDIWAALQVIDKKNAKKKENTVLKVYFFSDLVESMAGLERRDFHTRPPFSNAEAEQWANIDAKKFSEIDLEGVEIFYSLPFSPLSNAAENNPKVLKYWETLFSKFNVEEIKELGNE